MWSMQLSRETFSKSFNIRIDHTMIVFYIIIYCMHAESSKDDSNVSELFF